MTEPTRRPPGADVTRQQERARREQEMAESFRERDVAAQAWAAEGNPRPFMEMDAATQRAYVLSRRRAPAPAATPDTVGRPEARP